MSIQRHVSPPLCPLLPKDIEGFNSLTELSLDMRWSWNHATNQIWQQLDPVLWELTHNSWGLQTVSRDQIGHLLGNPAFRKSVDDLVQAKRRAAEMPTWFQKTYPQARLTCITYFSMEFMLSEALPIYSGGLGNVAGDQLKAASDLSVPVIGAGLLYQQGYFRQLIDNDGSICDNWWIRSVDMSIAHGVGYSRGEGLYGASHSAPRRCDGSSGSCFYPMRTVIKDTKVFLNISTIAGRKSEQKGYEWMSRRRP